jgi:regulator of sigma E protease
MLAWLAWLPLFGIIVFVHELGHFLAAKLTGVYAPRFSVGFGPALWRKRWGETEYVLAALPLGGYVRMASRTDETTAFIEGGAEEGEAAPPPRDWDPNALRPFGPRPIPEHRWFESKPLWQRLMIMLAGVTMNGLLAFVVYVGLAASLGRTVITTRVVGAVPGATAAVPAAQSLRFGDTLLAVEGRPVRHWNDVDRALTEAPGAILRFTTGRGPARLDVGEPSSDRREYVLGALEPLIPAVIDSVAPGRPAARAGIRAGDSIVAVNGTPVRTFADLVRHVSASPGRDLSLTVVRPNAPAPLQLVVRPDSAPGLDPRTGKEQVVGRIIAMPRVASTRESLSAAEAVRAGGRQTVFMSGAVLRALKGFVTRETSVSQLGGPIAIFRASTVAARNGVAEFFSLLALLSVNVAIFNLLPVPVLDGGQVLLNIAEAAKGSPFSDRTREAILRLGLVLIGLIFVVAMFNDTGLSRVFG